jgi:hypothetical protein
MNTLFSKHPPKTYLALACALCAWLVATGCAEEAQAATPTTRAVHAFLQGGDVDAQLNDDAKAPTRDLRVNVWHDRSDDETYNKGEPLNVHFRTNADMYVVVYRVDTEGRVEVLWPTTRYDDGFVYGNHTYTLPRPGAPVRLTASTLRGVEYLEAIGSEYPFDLRNLAIDFRFDPDSRGDYGYEVAGDPFLALNDINYAITGLESDVDYVVTDWAPLYVESKVEYARYTCLQCHDQDEHDYHPYVDHCTTVNIYSDWGWQTGWYNRFGWYPLYYEPPYYYWDISFGRPYWYSYYPLVYSWPSFGVYVRPYPVYWWYDSPYRYVDYRMRYKKHWRHYRPLYDLDGARLRLARRDLTADRSIGRSPESMRRGLRDHRKGTRVAENRLVRDRMTQRSHRGDVGPTVTTRRSGPRITDRSDPRRSGVRTDLSRRSESKRLQSLPSLRSPTRDGASNARGERRWTRPVLRNRDDPARRAPSQVDRRDARSRNRTDARLDRRSDRRTEPQAAPDRRRQPPPQRSADRDRRSTPSRSRDVKPPSRRSTPPPREKAHPTRRSGGERSRGGAVSPQRSSRSSSRSTPPPSRSSRSGSGSRSRGRRGGGR